MCFTCSVMEYLEQYSILKKEIIENAGSNFSLESVKDYYAAEINSKRALNRAKSLDAILKLLEERDILNCRNVTCLVNLGKLISHTKITNLVHSYKKLFLEGSDNDSCLCGLEYPHHQPEVTALKEQTQNRVSLPNNYEDADLIEAFRNISLKIGREWPVLARELDIEECYIDRITSRYPNDKVQQAFQALLVWKGKAKENATIQSLDKALDSRHCKRKGLSSVIRQRIIDFTLQEFII
ncbi:death domain-containing protein [Nephila pilipes]|uniref:Death domain-containing protein n=1 Tax=Nephila pilipes TaxID=299642 RepID=A0A8X6ULU9_NEPPI|nr:death domain-containing protein [Nephila pilipes]